MGNDLKYGKVTTERGNIPDDEPVFVLRAQDVAALPTLEDYADRIADLGCILKFRADVRAALACFRDYAGKRKLPD